MIDQPLTDEERSRWSAHDPSVARLLARMRTLFPRLRVVFKDDSRVYRFLNRFIPDEVLYRMSTTLFMMIAMGSREKAERDQGWYRRVLAHEFVHLFQFKDPIGLIMTYLAPQAWILLGGSGIISILTLCVPAFAGGILGVAIAAVALLSHAPWPSPWRLRCELAAYTMNLAVDHWTGKGFDDDDISRRAQLMSGWRYWKMAWSYRRARQRYAAHAALIAGGIHTLCVLSPAYRHVWEVLHGAAVPCVDDPAHCPKIDLRSL